MIVIDANEQRLTQAKYHLSQLHNEKQTVIAYNLIFLDNFVVIQSVRNDFIWRVEQ